ncbi:hypothetical protein MYU51_010767 [Penicillium brevicompactum]
MNMPTRLKDVIMKKLNCVLQDFRAYVLVELASAPDDDPRTAILQCHTEPTCLRIPQVLLEVNAFITKFELSEKRDSVRNGALLYHRPYGILGNEEDGFGGNADNHADINGKQSGSGRVPSICFATFLSNCYYENATYPSLRKLNTPGGFREAVTLQLKFYEHSTSHICRYELLASANLGSTLGSSRGLGASQQLLLFQLFLEVLFSLALKLLCEAPKRNHTIPMMMYIFNSMPIVGIARLIIASDSRVVIFIFSVLAVFLVLIVSTTSLESPYWLVMNARIPVAFDSLRSYRDTEIIAARDLYRIYVIDDPKVSKNGMFTWPQISSKPI